MSNELAFYGELLGEIKSRIRQAQVKAVLSVNVEMTLLYWDVGKMIHARQQQEGWGAGVIPRLSRDIRNELPELKGFSERNIGRMIAFFRNYATDTEILPQAVAKLEMPVESPASITQNTCPRIVQELLAQIPWGHNILLMEKLKDLSIRLWYARQVIDQGWSRDTLASMIKGQAHARQGAAVTNFASRLPASQSELAEQLLKDPYIFDFLTLEEPFHERELETGLVQHLEKFLLELGQGFAFVGRQYPLSVGEDDFYIDLLFYHLKLRAFVVIELKRGRFKPEYAGKMNFYCSVVDDKLRHETDQPTIGLILCQTKDRFIAEYALRDINKPIGVADYELTRALPDNLKSSLPSIEEIEAELQSELEKGAPMNPERLLQYFERISEAPDAIPRLRNFILDLAVRGKLVEQEPNDEPAAELLERIQVEKERLAKEGEIKRLDKFKSVETGEFPFAIPSGWEARRMGELARKLGAGSTPLGGKSVYQNEGVPFLRSQNVHNDGLWLNDVALITRSVHERMSGTHVQKQDILLNITGASIGRCALVPETFTEGNVSQHVAILRFFAPEIRGFIHLSLISPFFQRLIDDVQVGVSREGLSMQRLRLFPMLLPPLAEQHRIIAKVDELMTLCDQLDAAQTEREQSRDRLVAASLHRLHSPANTAENDALDLSAQQADAFCDHARFVFNHLPRLTTRPEHIKQLRQTILNLAVCGKLVPQNSNDEPATALLCELREAKDRLQVEENIRGRQPVPRTELSELGFTVPDSWELPAFDDVFVMVSGVTKGRHLTGRETIELPYLRVANVQRGYLDLSVMKTIYIPEDEIPRYALRYSDILMTEGGDWDKLGRAAIWLSEILQCIHQNHVFRVRSPLPEKLCPKWAVTYTNSLLGRSYFENAAKQTTNLASINMTQLRGCPLPLPPFAEQHRIVAKVDALMTLCDELEAQLTTTEADSRRLLEAVLHEALNPPLKAIEQMRLGANA